MGWRKWGVAALVMAATALVYGAGFVRGWVRRPVCSVAVVAPDSTLDRAGPRWPGEVSAACEVTYGPLPAKDGWVAYGMICPDTAQ